MDQPKWTILIATLGYRQHKLDHLLAGLLPQVSAAGGQVRVLALRNHAERPLGDVRQDLLEAADGEYVCFADDDDVLPDYYVGKVLPLLDGVDYVGWRMQCEVDGVRFLPTYHSLRYSSWFHDQHGWYRDISHLNPVRRALTEGTTFRAGWPEDTSWVGQLRGRLKTEHFIEECMYYYFASTSDTVQRGVQAGHSGTPAPDYGAGCPWFSWHPAST